MLKQILVSGN